MKLTHLNHTKQGRIAFSADCKRRIAIASANGAMRPAQFRFWMLLFLGLGIAPAAVFGAAFPQPAFLPLIAQADGGELNKWYLISNIILALILIATAFRPQPALHKQFADKEDTDKKLDAIFGTLEKLDARFENWSVQQSHSRAPIYERLTAAENALSFLAGKFAREGDPDADRLYRIIEQNKSRPK